jgi:hypothetical protein
MQVLSVAVSLTLQTQSSFGIDLQQMSFALTQATPRSLLVIDEFGKGTQPEGTDDHASASSCWADYGRRCWPLMRRSAPSPQQAEQVPESPSVHSFSWYGGRIHRLHNKH